MAGEVLFSKPFHNPRPLTGSCMRNPAVSSKKISTDNVLLGIDVKDYEIFRDAGPT